MFTKCIHILSLTAVMLLTACSPDLASVTPREAASMFTEKKAIILDVREDNEWNEQHIAGAIHIPLGQVGARLNELAQYKNDTVIVQCRSGKRSAKAADILQSSGFTQVYNLTGGIIAWANDGLDTIK